MLKQQKYYNFELYELNYNLRDIYNLIIDNFLRKVLFNIDSDFLVISSRKEFLIFREKVMLALEYIENLGLKFMNSNPTINGKVRRYLEDNTFNQKDIDCILKNTLNKIIRKSKMKSYYDILILKEYISKSRLKRIIKKYSKSDSDNVNPLEQHYIYCIHLRRKFLKLCNLR